MSREYADTKIKEALKLCNGNMTRARQHIITLAQEDGVLLNALVKPHLDGIVAYQVERVSSGRAELEKRHPEGGSLPRKHKVASKQHIEAIHKLAASRRNKTEK